MQTEKDFMEVIDSMRKQYKKGNTEYSGLTVGMDLKHAKSEDYDIEIAFDQGKDTTEIELLSHGLMIDCLYIPYNEIAVLTEI